MDLIFLITLITDPKVDLAERPKSTRAYQGWLKAQALVKVSQSYRVPPHICNAPTKLMRDLGHARDYRYEPRFAHPVYQEFFPPELKHTRLLSPRKAHGWQRAWGATAREKACTNTDKVSEAVEKTWRITDAYRGQLAGQEVAPSTLESVLENPKNALEASVWAGFQRENVILDECAGFSVVNGSALLFLP